MTDLISRADAIEAVRKCKVQDIRFGNVTSNMMLVQKAEVIVALSALPSADAEPKWNCTANFVAEQLDRLRKMTDEEKWNFFREFFGMGDAVQGEWCNRNSDGTWATVDFAYCSECKQPIIHKHASPLWRFCPNCGARMKGGAE